MQAKGGSLMIIKLIGLFWVVMGVVFLIKPEMLKNRLQRKSLKKTKRTLFIFTLILAVSLLWASLGVSGVVPKIIAILGIIGIIKAFFYLNSKTAEKLIEVFAQKPLSVFRAGAGVYILIGIAILTFSK